MSASAPATSAAAAVHQIQIEILEARGVQLFHRAQRIGGAVDAAQPLQLLRIEALRAERHPGDAGGAIVGEPAALDRAGIGLERHLDIARPAEQRAHACQQPRRWRRVKTGWACRRRGRRSAARGPEPRSPAQRGRASSAAISRLSGSAPLSAWELKSQYGHLRTHHGKCRYSDSGGNCFSTASPDRARSTGCAQVAAPAPPAPWRDGSARFFRRCRQLGGADLKALGRNSGS